VQTIQENIDAIKNQLKVDTILVAVTKHRSLPEIQAVYDAGIRDMGENRVQEFRDKAALLPADIRWHLIGRLQKNKVKYVVGQVHLIHSVDSLSLAKAIDDQSKKLGVSTHILLQINVSGEDTKQGMPVNELEDTLDAIAQLPNVVVKGLMTMAPDTKNIKVLQDIFTQTKTLYDRIKDSEYKYPNVTMEVLSMGMTNDYSIAVSCGANMVRIGSGIFKKEEA
jgi:hypothetical protein